MVSINGEKANSFIFPGGEIGTKVYNAYEDVEVRAILRSSNDIIELLLIANALKNRGCSIRLLRIPYIPYARQDRICNLGEPFSIKVFSELINSIKASNVEGWDVHSDVTNALINNFRNVHVSEILMNTHLMDLMIHDKIVLCSPDAGSLKKIQKVQSEFSIPNERAFMATKVRDTSTGNIIDTEVYVDHLSGKDVLIIDDICDGGRTFIELAKKIKNKGSGKIILYVTHGIFSKGIEVFDGLIDEIWTTNSFCQIKHPKLNIIGV